MISTSATTKKFSYDDLSKKNSFLSKRRALFSKKRTIHLKRNKFRYLVLHSGREEDPLTCSLHTTPIDDAPQYEAISYVWGSDKLDHPIVCNGKDLHITENLSMVLRRLRLQDTARVLWADSICINQTNLEEKSCQVALMSEIYRGAACVLICMDEDSHNHGPHVKALIEDVSNMIDEEEKKINTSASNTFPCHEVVPFAHDFRWDSIETLMGQEWFTRGWVVREAALAQESSVVWGRTEFSWEQLMLALIWCYTRNVSGSERDGAIYGRAELHVSAFISQDLPQVRCLLGDGFGANGISLLDCLYAGRSLQLSDPRDRIYAFIDIPTKERASLKVTPRYGDTPLEVYHDFAIEYLDASGDLEVMDYVVHDAQTLNTKLPTWAPSWNYLQNGPTPLLGDKPLASRSVTSTRPLLIGKTILKVQGVILDRIQFATDVFDGPTTTVKSLVDLWAVVKTRASDMPYHASLPQAFLSALTSRTYEGDWHSWQRACLRWMQHLVDAQDNSGNGSDRDDDMAGGIVLGVIREEVRGRRFLITSRGYLGLGPAVVQEGDLCAIIFGCTMPCVLRPTGQEEQFQFLGTCFLLGSQEYPSDIMGTKYCDVLGHEDSKDWVDWDVEEQDIYLV